MTNRRLLPLLNLLGCVILTAVAITQWRKEHDLHQRLFHLTAHEISPNEDSIHAHRSPST